jgi:hypothetical protein
MVRYWIEKQGALLAKVQPGGTAYNVGHGIGVTCTAYLDFDEEQAYLLEVWDDGVCDMVAVYWRPMDGDHLDVERLTIGDLRLGEKLEWFGDWVDDVRRMART